MFTHVAVPRQNDPCGPCVPVTTGRLQRRVSVVVLHIGVTAGQQNLTTTLIVTILGGQMEWRESAEISCAQQCAVKGSTRPIENSLQQLLLLLLQRLLFRQGTQELNASAVSSPGGLVQRRIPMLWVSHTAIRSCD